MKYFKYNPIEGELDVAFDDDLKLKKIQLDVSATPAASAPGLIQWNSTDGTYDMGLLNSSVLQVGQETMFYGKASGAIANGDLCQFAGVQGDHILMKKAVGSEIEANPHFLIGVATENISNGNFGYVTWFGKINGVYTKTPANQDSADWVAGDILYFNVTTGQLTKTMPSVPNRIIHVAAVIKEQTGASENGIIVVRPTFGIKLQDLDDVNGTPLTADGQIPVWNNTGKYFDFDKNLLDYVPYTGATGDVNLNSKNLAGVNTLAVKQTGTNAIIMGDVTGDARGDYAIDIQSTRYGDNTQVPSGYGGVCIGTYNKTDFGVIIGNENFSQSTGLTVGNYNEGYVGVYGGSNFNFGKFNISHGQTYNFGSSNQAYGNFCMNFGQSCKNSGNYSYNFGWSLYNEENSTVRIGEDYNNSGNFISFSDSGLTTKKSNKALEQIHSSGNVLATDYQSVGAEKIANGSFTTNTTGWTIGSFTRNAGGYMQKTADGTSSLTQASGSMTTTPVIGEYYLFTFSYSAPLQGTLTPSVAGVTFPTIGVSGANYPTQTIGREFSFIIKATATTGPAFTPSNDCRVTRLDNISLKKITGGDVIAVGRVIQAGTFAEIYVADGVTAQSIASGATYTKLTAFTNNGSSSNCTADATNDKITITKAGKYLVTCSVSGSDGVAGATFKMALFYDGVEQNNIHSTNKFNAGSEIDTMEMSGILVAAANKDIDVRLAHDGGVAVNFTTQYANLTITYIGE